MTTYHLVMLGSLSRKITKNIHAFLQRPDLCNFGSLLLVGEMFLNFHSSDHCSRLQAEGPSEIGVYWRTWNLMFLKHASVSLQECLIWYIDSNKQWLQNVPYRATQSISKLFMHCELPQNGITHLL